MKTALALCLATLALLSCSGDDQHRKMTCHTEFLVPCVFNATTGAYTCTQVVCEYEAE